LDQQRFAIVRREVVGAEVCLFGEFARNGGEAEQEASWIAAGGAGLRDEVGRFGALFAAGDQ
jgi:hypothetical protein